MPNGDSNTEEQGEDVGEVDALKAQCKQLDLAIQHTRAEASKAQQDLQVESQLVAAAREHVKKLEFTLRRSQALLQFEPVSGEIRIEIHLESITLPTNGKTTFADLVDKTLAYIGYEEQFCDYKRCEFFLRDAQGTIFCPEDVVVDSFETPPPWFAKLSTRTPMVLLHGLYVVFDPEIELIAYRNASATAGNVLASKEQEPSLGDVPPGILFANPPLFAKIWRDKLDQQVGADAKPFVNQANAMRSRMRRGPLLREFVFNLVFVLLTVFASFTMVDNAMPRNLVEVYTKQVTPVLHDLAAVQTLLVGQQLQAVQLRQLRVQCNDNDISCPRFSPSAESQSCFADRYCFATRPVLFNPSIWTVPRGLVEYEFVSSGGFFADWNASASSPLPLGFVDQATRLVAIEYNLVEPNVQCVVGVKILLQYLDAVYPANNATCSANAEAVPLFPYHAAVLIEAESIESSPVPSAVLCIVAILVGLGAVVASRKPSNGDLDMIAKMDQGKHLLQDVAGLLRDAENTAFQHRLQVPSFASRFGWTIWDAGTLALLFTGMVYNFATVLPRFQDLIANQMLPSGGDYIELQPYFFAKQTCSVLLGFAAWMAVLGSIRNLRLVRPGMLVVETALTSAFPGLLILCVCCVLPAGLAFGAAGQLIQPRPQSNVWFVLSLVTVYLFVSTLAFTHVFYSFTRLALRNEHGVFGWADVLRRNHKT
ncbi:hypothetical protein BASA81_002455 [Batrachochytrium salamandrivorans]|nr:hypothetical protein BASA81_002455 [Batrachochytrium salamandrivorans]